MKPFAVVALSVLTLAGSIAGAEARGFRLRTKSFSVPYRSPVAYDPASSRLPAIATLGLFDPRPVKTSVVTRSVMTTDGLGTQAALDDAGPIPPMPPEPQAAKKPAEPWCKSGRTAGSGQGFCLIN